MQQQAHTPPSPPIGTPMDQTNEDGPPDRDEGNYTSNSLLISDKEDEEMSEHHDEEEDEVDDEDEEDFTRVHSSWGELLRRKVAQFGEICYFKLVPRRRQVFVVFASCSEAATAMAALQKDYHVEYGEYSGLHMLGDIAKLTLQVPPQKRAFLLSPPPSPPEGWAPICEDINRIPYVDLTPSGNILLPPRPAAPSIVVVEPTDEPDSAPSSSASTPTIAIPQTKIPPRTAQPIPQTKLPPRV